MSDKVRELARKVLGNGSYVKEVDRAVATIRAELEPLLDIVKRAQCCIESHASERKCLCREMAPELAAELQGWTARTPDGR